MIRFADKFLIASCFLVLAIQTQIPTWVVAIVLGRDLVIFGGAIAYRVLYKELEIAPTMLQQSQHGFSDYCVDRNCPLSGKISRVHDIFTAITRPIFILYSRSPRDFIRSTVCARLDP